MPRVGSSRISTSASVKIHLLRTTFCWLPPDSLPAWCSTVGVLMFRSARYSSATLSSSLPFTQPRLETFRRPAAVMLRQLNAQGITCIMISHKLNELASIADRTTIIRDGRTIETLDMKTPEATLERMIRSMVGRDPAHRYPERTPEIGEEVLRVEDWTVLHPTQAGRVIVDQAGFAVHAGEVIGIAGLMGAGRTELAMSIFGRSYGRQVSGRIYKRGQEIQLHTVSDAIANGVAYATEDRKKYGLNLIEDIRRNITAAGLRKVSSRGWVNGNEELKVAEEYRADLNIKTPTVLHQAGKLSGGNQQKVVLSKWIFTCLLYTSDAADEEDSVDLGGRRIIKK